MSDIHRHKITQQDFAAHIRNPDKHPKPEGIDEVRMQVYRDLFFNNISGLIKQTFPVLASLYQPPKWTRLIRNFYQKQHNQTPYFTEIADEFLEFLKQQPIDAKRPFVYELAYYEWLELALEKNPIKPVYHELEEQHLRKNIPVITPLIKAKSYHYPVHQISPDNQPTHSDRRHHLMVWRTKNQTIQFAQLNTLSLQLLTQLQQHELSGDQAIALVFKSNGIEANDQTIAFGRQQLDKWHQQDIIINIQ